MTSGEPKLSGGLPTRFPIFPLPGAILLPNGHLPLNIFEPRYLHMTRDAMRTDRVIGMIQLTGVCRYDVVEELSVGTPYRQVMASFDRWRCDLEPPTPPDSLRPPLLDALRRYFDVYEISCDWDQIEAAPLGGLTTSLAMICPFEACEKQALLEAADHEQRCRILTSLLQMGALGCKDPSAGARH